MKFQNVMNKIVGALFHFATPPSLPNMTLSLNYFVNLTKLQGIKRHLNPLPANSCQVHFVKNVKIRSLLWSVFSCIRNEYGDLLQKISVFSPTAVKHGPENTPYLDTFHAVLLFHLLWKYDKTRVWRNSEMSIIP